MLSLWWEASAIWPAASAACIRSKQWQEMLFREVEV